MCWIASLFLLQGVERKKVRRRAQFQQHGDASCHQETGIAQSGWWLGYWLVYRGVCLVLAKGRKLFCSLNIQPETGGRSASYSVLNGGYLEGSIQPARKPCHPLQSCAKWYELYLPSSTCFGSAPIDNFSFTQCRYYPLLSDRSFENAYLMLC